MFSFGIFSTHIPYIAFVAFYAYFLLFGVEKASKGELQSEKSAFFTELQAEHSFIAANQQNHFFYHNDFIDSSTDFEPFIFKRKIRPPINLSVVFQQMELYHPLSNRPPPVIG